MKKILVTTDLSANSKSAIRFAIQLASQRRSALIVYHFAEFVAPTRWSAGKSRTYVNEMIEEAKAKLERFVDKVLSDTTARLRIEYVVQSGTNFQRALVNYASESAADAICIGTRGAGTLKKLMGTNSSAILTSSPVPVFVIPNNYRPATINNVFYASDLNDLASELRLVKRFADPLGAKVAVYHYDYLYDVAETKKKLAGVADRFRGSGVKFNFQKLNLEQPLADQLTRDFRKSKASLAILFTNQKRSWFDRVFLSSKTADISFTTKIPLLVYPKA